MPVEGRVTAGAFVCGTCGERYATGGFCAHDGAPLAVAEDVLLGTELGRYRLARVLGAGGMSKVYLGVQPAIGSRVAIKVLGDACAANPELLERFFAEARAVNLIRHEHIISVLDLAKLPDGRPYIVMEFVAGQTLGDLVRGDAAARAAPLGGIVRVMLEVLSALAAAHAIGIVHRDLKPDNILVTAEGHAKVLDFGIAKLAPGLGHHDSPRTATGALLGTPAYMAPEQIAGAQNVDARTDLYAAGVVLFEAVVGRPPFQSPQLFELMRAHLETPAPAVRTIRPELPEAIERVIATALAKDPAHRYQSAAEMMRALEVVAADLPPAAWQSLASGRQIVQRPSLPQVSAQQPAPSPSQLGPRAPATVPSAPPTAHTRRRSPALWVGLAVAVVAVAVAAVVVATRGDGGGADGAAASAAPSVAANTGSASPAIVFGGGGGASTPDVRQPDVQRANGQNADGRQADGENTDGRQADGQPADGRETDGRKPDGRKPDGQKPDGRKPDGRKPDAHAADVQQPDGQKPDGQKRDGQKPDVRTPDGRTPDGHAADVSPPDVPKPDRTAPPDLGPGVTIEGNVKLEQTHTRSLTVAADYDPRHFDPLAYLPKAQALAQKLLPDAGFTEFEMYENVWPTGAVDLTQSSDHDSYFEFRSPSHSKRPPNIPDNKEVDLYCRVVVEVHAKTVEAAVRTGNCDAILRRPPRCTLARVWDLARAEGARTGNVVATIGFLHDGTWFFDLDGVRSFRDCP